MCSLQSRWKNEETPTALLECGICFLVFSCTELCVNIAFSFPEDSTAEKKINLENLLRGSVYEKLKFVIWSLSLVVFSPQVVVS